MNANGHATDEPVQYPQNHLPPQERPPTEDYTFAIRAIYQWRMILNARLLALLALVGALIVFGFTINDPTPLRLWGASLYSVGVLWPVIGLFLRKG